MTAATSMAWSGDAVPLRRRADLELRPSFAAPGQAWLVKDPVALRYYELPEEEHFVWARLDGRATWSELRDEYARAFAPKQLDDRRMLQLLDELHRRGLVVSDRAGQGSELRRRGQRLRRDELLRYFTNPLAIRLPGFNPQRLLSWLAPWTAPIFSRGFVVAYFAICALAVVTTLVHFEALRRELSAAAGAFPDVADWPYWLAAIAGAKIVHELAHAVVCRRFGGECRELGLMLLCGVPCLYCDVTSMWMTPERWKRIAVGAAGMAAEVLLAAVAVLLWRLSEPGVLHLFCLHLAIVCSLGTLVVNANPLLRYDGYFILADLAGVTNLGERADAALRSATSRWFIGESFVDERHEPRGHRAALAAFALASVAYRWLLMIGVLWFFRRWLIPHGLALVADLLTLAVVASLIVGPVRRAAQAVWSVRSGNRGDGRRFAVRGAAAICFVVALMLWPWPYRVGAPAVVQLRDAEYHYVVVGGELADGATLGTSVQSGDVIARLSDPQLAVEVRRLEADVARRRLEVANLERRRVADPSQGDALPTAREMLAAAERQWDHLQREQRHLIFVAQRSGTVLPLVAFQSSADDLHEQRSPLESERRGAYLKPGTPLCAVGNPTMLEAELTVDQHEIEFLAPGQTVQVRCDALPDRIISGHIVEVAAVERGDAGVTNSADADRKSPLQTEYLARVALDETIVDLPIGAVGRAKVDAAPQSLWSRLRRALEATFRFDREAP